MVDHLPIRDLCAYCFDILILDLNKKKKKPFFPDNFKGV